MLRIYCCSFFGRRRVGTCTSCSSNFSDCRCCFLDVTIVLKRRGKVCRAMLKCPARVCVRVVKGCAQPLEKGVAAIDACEEGTQRRGVVAVLHLPLFCVRHTLLGVLSLAGVLPDGVLLRRPIVFFCSQRVMRVASAVSAGANIAVSVVLVAAGGRFIAVATFGQRRSHHNNANDCHTYRSLTEGFVSSSRHVVAFLPIFG